jgi:hypothetical protein
MSPEMRENSIFRGTGEPSEHQPPPTPDEHAAAFRAELLRNPAFLELARASQEAERNARLIGLDELQRKYPAAD